MVKNKNAVEKWGEAFPLTALQLSYYYGRNGKCKEKPIYLYTQLECGSYDSERMQNAVKRTVNNCPALRTVILENGMQRICAPDDDMEFSIPFTDISDLPESDRQAEFEKITRRICATEIPTGTYPMMYMETSKISENKNVVHIYIDGLICDAWTSEIIVSMIDRFYSEPDSENIDTVSCEEYAKSTSGNTENNEDRCFWKTKIRDFPDAPVLPMTENYSSLSHDVPTETKLFLSNEQMKRIEQYATEKNVTLFSVYFAVFCRCISMYSENQDFTVNIPCLTRNSENKNMCGECSDFILFPYVRKKGETFSQEISRLCTELEEYQKHNSVSGSFINKEYQEVNNSFGELSAPVVFSYMLDIPKMYQGELRRLDLCTHTSQVWADCVIVRKSDGVSVNIDSSKNILRDGTDERLSEQIRTAFSEIDSWDEITSIPLARHDRDIISSFLDSGTIDISVPYAVRIEEAIKKFGSRPAVYTEETECSFDEFYSNVRKRINILQGLRPELHDRIAVVMGKNHRLIEWSQAIVLGGYVYAPLDYQYSPELMKKCLENLSPAVIITDGKWFDTFTEMGYNTVREDIQLGTEESGFVPCSPEDKFAVIHTSGSTGIPKGAEITHAGVLNCLYYSEKEFGITENDCTITITNHCHDMSLYDQFGLFISGGACAVVSQENALDPYSWRDMIIERNVTIWNSVPPIMSAFLAFLEEDAEEIAQQLRLVIHGGDYFTAGEAKLLKDYSPDITLYNVGGPTETTIWNIYHKVTDEDILSGTLPYGKPFPSVKYAVLNRYMEWTPAGVKGEMFISGIGTAKGYIDGRDSEKFVTDSDGVLWYRCGDMGILTDNGHLLISGRNDNQIKRNGKRIEFDGIETSMRKLSGISNAKVTAQNGNMEIIAFYTGDTEYGHKELKSKLSELLPEYMIPDAFLYVEAFPLTHNGKVNIKALLDMYESSDDDTENSFSSSPEQLEEFLKICEKNMQISGLKADDNFFRTGGNSLMAIMLTAELNDIYGCDLSLADIFTCPVLGEICDLIHENE